MEKISIEEAMNGINEHMQAAEKARSMLATCSFCESTDIARWIPPANTTTDIFRCKCRRCGAVGGLERGHDGKLYAYWKAAEVAGVDFDVYDYTEQARP